MALVAPWYSNPAIKRLDGSLLEQIQEANCSTGLKPSIQVIQHSKLHEHGALFEGKYYAACITLWINKRSNRYSMSCDFADIQGVFTSRNYPMAVSLLDCCDIAMYQIVECLRLGVLQPAPFKPKSLTDVQELLVHLEQELAAQPEPEDGEEGVPLVVFLPVYPLKVGIEEIDNHSKAEARLAEEMIKAGVELDGSPMDSLAAWMAKKDELRAFVLSWDYPRESGSGWVHLNFRNSKM